MIENRLPLDLLLTKFARCTFLPQFSIATLQKAQLILYSHFWSEYAFLKNFYRRKQFSEPGPETRPSSILWPFFSKQVLRKLSNVLMTIRCTMLTNFAYLVDRLPFQPYTNSQDNQELRIGQIFYRNKHQPSVILLRSMYISETS